MLFIAVVDRSRKKFNFNHFNEILKRTSALKKKKTRENSGFSVLLYFDHVLFFIGKLTNFHNKILPWIQNLEGRNE